MLRYLEFSCEVIALALAIAFCIEGKWDFHIWCLAIAIGIAILTRKQARSFSIKAVLLAFSLFTLRATIAWAARTFPLDYPLQVYLTLQMPKDGLTAIFVKKYIIDVLLFGFIICLFLSPLASAFLVKIKRKRIILAVPFLVILALNALSVFISIPYKQYFELMESKQYSHSVFFQQNFVYSDSNTITLKTEQPRNLILIIMESMENSFAEYIPEITALEKIGVNFSSDTGFGGGIEVSGTDFTAAATAAITTGIPLVAILGFGDTVLANATSIYDVLKEQNYTNIFIQGSNANFSNTRPFLIAHGMDQVFDINNLGNKQNSKDEYKHLSYSIGITDKFLMDISKRILDTLASTKPFSLTITTIETHFPHGFYNEECEDKPDGASEESELIATLRCASKNINDFVAWVKDQPFAANTEIVIVGDHLFKGKILIPNTDENRRWVNLFINPALVPRNRKLRRFTSMDMAPTILESMGYELSSHRMGFGISLYSEEKTLLEKMGKDSLNLNLNKQRTSIEYNALNIHGAK